MRITRIVVGRTFNTGNYTSHRYELEAELDGGEEAELAILDLSSALYRMACSAMVRQGVRYIREPGAERDIDPPQEANQEGDVDEIPF